MSQTERGSPFDVKVDAPRASYLKVRGFSILGITRSITYLNLLTSELSDAVEKLSQMRSKALNAIVQKIQNLMHVLIFLAFTFHKYFYRRIFSTEAKRGIPAATACKRRIRR